MHGRCQRELREAANAARHPDPPPSALDYPLVKHNDVIIKELTLPGSTTSTMGFATFKGANLLVTRPKEGETTQLGDVKEELLVRLQPTSVQLTPVWPILTQILHGSRWVYFILNGDVIRAEQSALHTRILRP